MLWTICVILITLWLFCLARGFGDPLIHVLPVMAAGMMIYSWIRRRPVVF